MREFCHELPGFLATDSLKSRIGSTRRNKCSWYRCKEQDKGGHTDTDLQAGFYQQVEKLVPGTARQNLISVKHANINT